MSKGCNQNAWEFTMWLGITLAVFLYLVVEGLKLLGICSVTMRTLGLCQ